MYSYWEVKGAGHRLSRSASLSSPNDHTPLAALVVGRFSGPITLPFEPYPGLAISVQQSRRQSNPELLVSRHLKPCPLPV